MAASSTDKLIKASSGTRPSPTTLNGVLASGSSPGTASVAAQTGWPTDTAVAFCIYTLDSNNKKVANSQTDWIGISNGTNQISSLTLIAGTNTGYAIGAVVEAAPIAAWADRLVGHLLTQHNQDGTHGATTATSLSVSGTTSLTGALTLNSYDGWITSTDTWTYASASSFTISGVDRTAQFPVGTKIKLTQTTAKYFYVTSTSFSTNTTVNIFAGTDYTLANAAITSPTYSYDTTPQAFPGWINYTPAWTTTGTAPAIGNGTLTGAFQQIGKTVHFRIKFIAGTTTTFGTNAWRFSFPVAASSWYTAATNTSFAGSGYAEDNGVNGYQAEFGIAITSTTFQVHYVANGTAGSGVYSTSGPFAWGSTDYFTFSGTYEAA